MSGGSPVILSIIIVNFETPRVTLECLHSIYRHAPACEFEVILIDNGSRDGSLERIRSERPEVVCIETGSNLGFAKANNLGIHNARGTFVLLLNSDTQILDNSLDRLLEYLLANPEVGAVGPRQLDAQGRLQLSWGSFPTLFTEILRKIVHKRLSVNDLKIRDYLEERYRGSTDVDWISGSCLMARRKTLVEAGLLDPAFFMYFEDIDLCSRIRNVGSRVHFLSETMILHHGGVTAKKNILHILLEYRRSQIYFTRKHYGRGGVWVLKSLLFLKSVARMALCAVSYLADRLRRRPANKSFANLLLCKKTIEMVFSRVGSLS